MAGAAATGPRGLPPEQRPTAPKVPPPSIRRLRAPAPAPVTADERALGLAAGQVMLGGLLGLVVAILLNSGALLSDAEQKPFGRSRDVSVAVWEPIEAVSSAIGLTKPREWADDALGRGDSSSESNRVETASEPTTTAAAPNVSEDGVQRIDVSNGLLLSEADDGAGGDDAAGDDAVDSVIGGENGEDGPADATDVAAGTPTPDRPLDLWIVGDSMVQFFGDTMASMANATEVVDATAESKLSSGLTRPDFFDWPARLGDLLAAEDPDALVIMFGGNDAQGITTPNGVAQPFSDAWIAEYSARVGAVMDQVTQGSDRQVLWVGQPIMRSGDFDAKMQQLNSIYEAEARSRPTVTFVSTRALFQNPAGQYDRYLPGSDGDLVDVRLSDGVHLSTAGGRWLSELLLDELATLYDLESGRLTP